MKKLTVNRAWLVAVGLSLATTAMAQKEQWLRYYTSSDGRSYQYIELTTNAPAGLKLPQLNAAPYFARWLTPLDPAGGRWMCFDRSKKSGAYDKLYIDSKGSGKLDTEPVGILRTDPFSTQFQPVKLVFKGEDGPIAYHLQLRFMKYQNDEARLLSSSGCYYAGDVDLGGKKRRLELTDANVNGTFNDCGATVRESDRVGVKDNKDGDRYLGKLLEVDGVFYRIEVARDGAFVKIQKAENVEFGKVKVPETLTVFSAFGPNGHFTRKPVKGELTLPVGAYDSQDWTISRKDKSGASWELMAYRTKESCKFEVTSGSVAKALVGEPVRMEMEAKESTNTVNFSLSFLAPSGESIQLMKGEQRPPGPKLIIASLDGSYRSTNTFEFG